MITKIEQWNNDIKQKMLEFIITGCYNKFNRNSKTLFIYNILLLCILGI